MMHRSNRRTRARGLVSAAVCATGLLVAGQAQAFVYVTGSVSASTTTLPFQNSSTAYGSGTIDFDLGRFIRLGYTYSEQVQQSQGYQEDDSNTSGNAVPSGIDSHLYVEAYNRTIVTAHAVDLTLILYPGDVFVPFLLGGGILKNYTFETQQGTQPKAVTQGAMPLMPNGGVGVGIRLNRSFTLKLSYLVSPGFQQAPKDAKIQRILDRQMTVSLSYRI